MSEQTNNTGRTVLIIAIIVLIIIALGGGWYWGIYQPEQEAKERARQEQIARKAAEEQRKKEAAERKTRYDKLIEEADVEFELENWEGARALYEEASGLFPDEQYPKDQLRIVNEKLDELAASEAKIEAGIIETISAATGRYYIIVSSSIDQDLAMDYAKKLADQGNDVKIIKHDTEEHIYYRVAMGDYAAPEDAEAAKGSFGDYGDGIWVLAY